MTQAEDVAPLGFPEAADKGLKSGALGLISSVVVGMASTAPAYSLAASLGLVVATGGSLLAGVKAPAIILLAFVPMYFIAVAYDELNKAEPDCGTTFTWAARAFGPWVGWMGGWGIIAADVIVMANLAQIAGAYSYRFAADLGLESARPLGDDTFWATIAGLVWIAVMTYICYRGIEVSARLQYGLLAIEVAVLGLFSVVALARVYSGNAEPYSLHPSWSWFWPGGMSFGDVIAPSILAAVFIYWGWDTAVTTNEEADDPATTPGRAAVISTVLLVATYLLVTVAAVAFAGVGTEGVGLGNADNSGDVFAAVGPDLFGGGALGKLCVLLLSASILTSASASTQTTILPTARTALSMGAYKALPASFTRIHPRYLTPTVATVVMGAVSAGFFLLFTWVSPNLLSALIGSVGLMIAFYYGLTGLACVWFYRRTLTASRSNLVRRGLLPGLGGAMLFAAFGYALKKYAEVDWLTEDLADGTKSNVTIFGVGAVAVVGVAAMVLGLVVMALWRVAEPAFFTGRTLGRRGAHDLILVGAPAEEETFRLPDSGLPDLVIAPDLSNLPEGGTAVDLGTGEPVRRPGDPTS